MASEPVKISLKLRVFFSQYWNIWDMVAILMFSTAVGLRMYDETRKAARILYTLNIVFFYIRILEILSVNQYLGPYVKIIGKLVSYGVKIGKIVFCLFVFYTLFFLGGGWMILEKSIKKKKSSTVVGLLNTIHSCLINVPDLTKFWVQFLPTGLCRC